MMAAEARSTLILDRDEIHLWFCRGAHSEEHRNKHLAARALVRNTLSLYSSDVSPDQWRFSTNEHGKPHISAPVARPLQFNLSHTSGMIVLAIARNGEVGVDVERQLRGEDSLELAHMANRFFSPREARELCALPLQQQADRFYDLWTLKEAYVKACGRGLSMPLDRFGFRFPCGRGVEIEFHFSSRTTDDPRNWKFWLLKASKEHKVGLAVRADASENSFHLSFGEAGWPGTKVP